MAGLPVHSNPAAIAQSLLSGYSLEVTAKDMPGLTLAAPGITPGTLVFIPYLPRESDAERIAAVRTVRGLGFEPVLHLSARRMASSTVLEDILAACGDSVLTHCLVLGGDPSTPQGPFADS